MPIFLNIIFLFLIGIMIYFFIKFIAIFFNINRNKNTMTTISKETKTPTQIIREVIVNNTKNGITTKIVTKTIYDHEYNLQTTIEDKKVYGKNNKLIEQTQTVKN